MTCKAPAKESTDHLVRVPSYLAVFKILSLIFVILIVVCLRVDLFGLILLWLSVLPGPERLFFFTPSFGKFSALIASNNFSDPSLSLSLSLLLLGCLWCECWYAWCCPRSLFNYPFKNLFFFSKFFLFLFFCSAWGDFQYFIFQFPDLFLGIFLNCCWCLLVYFYFSCYIRQLCLVLSIFSFLNFSLCSAILLPCSLSIFMIITLNSILSKSCISTYFSSSRVLYCSFTWNIFLCCLSLPESLFLFLLGMLVTFLDLGDTALCSRHPVV